MRILLSVFLLALSLVGCTNSETIGTNENKEKSTTDEVNVKWKPSPTFFSGNYLMRGEKGKLGFMDAPFVAGQKQKYMWHFWGKPEDFNGVLEEDQPVYTGRPLLCISMSRYS
ncbi:hypothetical protein [Effusibacillus consociatus]|uniref:Uncharacterized protein n=1 Tax=Effusibacillus consociatus TaxID=1117041 RepID=A0ABV9PYI5_9BACL